MYLPCVFTGGHLTVCCCKACAPIFYLCAYANIFKSCILTLSAQTYDYNVANNNNHAHHHNDTNYNHNVR